MYHHLTLTCKKTPAPIQVVVIGPEDLKLVPFEILLSVILTENNRREVLSKKSADPNFALFPRKLQNSITVT